LRFPDEQDYHNLAVNLVKQHAYLNERLETTAARPPGYPFALAATYSVWNRPLAAKLINALACALTAIVLSRLAAAIDPNNYVTRWLVLALTLCYPLFLYVSSTLYPQILGTLMLAGCLLLLVGCSDSWKGAIGAGLLFGLLVLTIPSFLLWLPFFPVYLIIADRAAAMPMFRRAVIFSVCAVLVIAPWTVRNFMQFRSLIPISTNSGINLLLGNSPNTTPNSGVNVDLSDYLLQAEKMNEVEQDKFFKQCAVSYIKQNPSAAVRLYLLKVANYFNYQNRLNTKSETSRVRDMILFLTYYPLLLAALIRLLLYRRFRLGLIEIFFYCLYFGNAFLSAIFFTRVRFRIPFDALLIVLVAVFAGRVYSEMRERRRLAGSMIQQGS